MGDWVRGEANQDGGEKEEEVTREGQMVTSRGGRHAACGVVEGKANGKVTTGYTPTAAADGPTDGLREETGGNQVATQVNGGEQRCEPVRSFRRRRAVASD